jgi:hypothetical protein
MEWRQNSLTNWSIMSVEREKKEKKAKKCNDEE